MTTKNEPGKDKDGKTIIGRPPVDRNPVGNQDPERRGLGKTAEEMKAEREREK